MKRIIIAAALAGTTIAGLAAAQTPAPTAPARQHRALALDLNKDGVITRAEVLAAADARFAQLDANRDGKISATERPNKRGGKVQEMTREQLRAKALARFDRADGNKDGKIEASEKSAMRGKHGRNRDSAGQTDMGGPGAGGPGMGGPDRDGPGMDREGKHGGGRGRGGGGGMNALTMADTNRDGVVTKAEVTTAAQVMFDRIDTNRDGRIDKDERKASRSDRKMRRAGGSDGPDGGER